MFDIDNLAGPCFKVLVGIHANDLEYVASIFFLFFQGEHYLENITIFYIILLTQIEIIL
jgi:hypothetical protein